MRLGRMMAGTLALALVLGSNLISASDTQAAAKKPKLKKKTVSVYKGKTDKIQIKGSKIKKTKWSVKKKSIATISKKRKTSVVVKGKKKGTTTVTAKVTVKGKKKPYTLKCTVKVKNRITPSVTPTPKTTNKPTYTVKPTVKPTEDPYKITYVKAPEIKKSEPEATSVPDAAVTTNTNIYADFDSYSVGDSISTSGDEPNNKFINTKNGDFEGDTIDGFTTRVTGFSATKNLTVSVVDVSSAGRPSSSADEDIQDNVSDNCLKISNRNSVAQGGLIELKDKLEPGATYKFTGYIKMASDKSGNQIYVSTQTRASENTAEVFSNLNKVNSTSDWIKVTATVSVPDDAYSFGLYIEASNDASTDIYIDGVSLVQTKRFVVEDDLPSLKDTYSKYFDHFGCAVEQLQLMSDTTSQFVSEQFNSVTFGNEMKPTGLMNSTISLDKAKELGYYIPEGYEQDENNKNAKGEVRVPYLTFDVMDAMLMKAKECGLKVRGHVFNWHQQTPTYFFKKSFTNSEVNVTPATMDKRLDFFIRNVMRHALTSEYKDVIYAWDVTNEYLHTLNGPTALWHIIYNTVETGASGQKYMSLTPSYVKLSFQIAHDELVKQNRTDIKLYYNDYNTYDVTDNIIKLLRWVNMKDDINTYGQICDGVGMQAHLDMTDSGNNPTVQKFADTMEMFKVNLPNLEISVTELDVTLGLNGTANTLTDMDQASYYEDIMRATLDCKKRGGNINSVTLWGLHDGISWRSAQTPCIFKGFGSPKAAFFALFDAIDTYYTDPFINN